MKINDIIQQNSQPARLAELTAWLNEKERGEVYVSHELAQLLHVSISTIQRYTPRLPDENKTLFNRKIYLGHPADVSALNKHLAK